MLAVISPTIHVSDNPLVQQPMSKINDMEYKESHHGGRPWFEHFLYPVTGKGIAPSKDALSSPSSILDTHCMCVHACYRKSEG